MCIKPFLPLGFKKDTSIPSSARDNSDWKSIFVASSVKTNHQERTLKRLRNTDAKQDVRNNSKDQQLPVDDEFGVVEAVNKTCEWKRITQLRKK